MVSHTLSGNIEVVCGPMFSGKTEELIRRVRRAQIARQKVQIFKPVIDNRYHKTKVVSHSSQEVEAQVVDSSIDILKSLLDSTRIVAIDEVQFFDDNIILVIKKLSRRGIRVICAGLDLDYKSEPFGQMPFLLAMADDVLKVHAICTVCGSAASKTYRKEASGPTIIVGETNLYEARCSTHYDYFDDNEDELLAFSIKINNNQSAVATGIEDEGQSL